MAQAQGTSASARPLVVAERMTGKGKDAIQERMATNTNHVVVLRARYTCTAFDFFGFS